MNAIHSIAVRLSKIQLAEGETYDVLFNYHETFGSEFTIPAIYNELGEFYFKFPENSEFIAECCEREIAYFADRAFDVIAAGDVKDELVLLVKH